MIQEPPSPLPPPFAALPQSERERPAIMTWRLDHLEERVALLEGRRRLPRLDRLPWVQIAGVAMLLGLGLTGHLTRADALNIARRLLGM